MIEHGGADEVVILDLMTGSTVHSNKLPWDDSEMTSYGEIFATNGSKGVVHLWNYVSDVPMLTLLGEHKDREVNDGHDEFFDFGNYVDAMLLNESLLLTNGDTIRFWDMVSGHLLGEMIPNYDSHNLYVTNSNNINVTTRLSKL